MKLLGIAVLVLLFGTAACSERDPSDGATATAASSGTPELEVIAAAVERAGTYRLLVEQSNLVLPRWGGSDGGTVGVDLRSGAAHAQLLRTGDGNYEVVLREGETSFKRETCSTWARIQDGAEVLAPFVITPAELRASRVLPGGDYELQGLGRVTMEVDGTTSLPRKIRSATLTNNSRQLTWRFEAWGEPVAAPNFETSRLSGPGGNPC